VTGTAPGRALLVRLSAIGDVVHTLPVAAVLHDRGWHVTWVVEPAARPLLEGNPKVDGVVPAPPARKFRLGPARETKALLRSAQPSVVLELQGLWKSAVWARLAGAPRVVGFAGADRREPLSSTLLRELVAAPGDAVHVIDKNLSLLRALGLDARGSRDFPLPRAEAEQQRIDDALARGPAGEFVILNPGGGWSSKLWSPEAYGDLARGLHDRGLRAVVTWGPGEERLADRVVAASLGTAVRAQPTTLLEYVALARRARLVVAGDTGPLHLACAARTPVVGIFGPTDPARNGPWSPRDVTVRRRPLCAPCHRRACPTPEGVMDAIPAAEVLKAVDRRLGQSPPDTVAV
jgi:ADP-heptose:LPS heptosyltransferase